MFNPYEDDSYLDIPVFRLDGYTPDGDIIDSSWVIEEDIDREIDAIKKWYPECDDIRIIPCELRDCPKHVREEILNELDDIKAQEDYENIKYCRELY